MGPIRMLAGAELRRRWRGIVVLTLLVGVVGGLVLATVAGARRSDTALDRFTAWSRAGDIELSIGGRLSPSQVAAIRGLPGVADVAVLDGLGIAIPRAPELSAIAAPADAKFGADVDRARIVAGRAADQHTPGEVTIGENLAAQLHVHVGDHLDGRSYSVAQTSAALAGTENPTTLDGPPVRLRIVGIDRRPLDLGDRGATGGVLILTRAFDRKFANKTIGSFGVTLRIRTRRGQADVAGVVAGVRRIATDAPYVQVTPLNIESQGAGSAINVLTVALWIFAGVAALAGLVAIAIVLTREIWLVSVDQPTLRALGLTARQRIALNGFPALIVASGGALLAVLGAPAASPLFPIGLARRADPDLGFHADGLVLALGVVAVVAVVLVIGWLAALRSAARRSLELEGAGPRRTSKTVELAARSGLAPTTTNGLRMALEPGRGRNAVPVRSAYLGAVFGIVGIVAVMLFASSLDRLVSTPRQYGWTFDYAATDQAATGCNRADYGLGRVPGVTAVAGVCSTTVTIDRDTVIGWSFTPIRRTIGPEVVEGRAPSRAREVALGSVTLSTLGKRIGDTVSTRGPSGGSVYRIVGRVVLANLGSPPQPLADGAVFTAAGLRPVSDPNNGNRYLAVRFAPGIDRATVERRLARFDQLVNPATPTVPPEIDRLRQIDWFPATLATLLAVLALLAVGHTLVTAVRRRRRDLALLKTLGFNRRQLRSTIAWQATTLGTVGLIAGIPAGLIVGSLAWRLVADGLGESTTASIPAVALLLTVPSVLVLVNLIAYFPARSAARTRPAVALRAE